MKAGDVVVLKGQNIPMTVLRVDLETGGVSCVWFGATHELETAIFLPEVLEVKRG